MRGPVGPEQERWPGVVAGLASGGTGATDPNSNTHVVVVDVVDDEPLELAAVPDDGAVKELAAQGSDPVFGERVRYGVRGQLCCPSNTELMDCR